MASKKDTKSTSTGPKRVGEGVYEINGKRIPGAKDSATAQKMYDKKYGSAKAAAPAAETPAATTPPASTSFTDQGPNGSTTTSIDAAGNVTNKTALSNQEQSIQDANQQATSGAYNRVEDFQKNPFEYQQQFQSAFDKVYGLGKNKLDERFGQEDTALRQRLANEGITEGSEQYNQRMKGAADQRSQAYGDLQGQSLDYAGQQYDRAFNTRRNYEDMAKGLLRGAQQPTTNTNAYSDNYYANQRQNSSLAADRENAATQREWQAGQNAEDRGLTRWQTNKSLANRGGGGGGGGGAMSFEETLARQQAMNDMQFNQWKRQQDYATANQPKQSKPNAFAGLAGSFMNAAAQGAGQAAFK